MKFEECQEKLKVLLGDKLALENLKEEVGDVDEIFIASSDFSEMYSDFNILKENDFDLEEDHLTCEKQDFCLYALSREGVLAPVPVELL